MHELLAEAVGQVDKNCLLKELGKMADEFMETTCGEQMILMILWNGKRVGRCFCLVTRLVSKNRS